MRSNARLMGRWTSSGSNRSDSDVKPETSTNSTVTCLRSPCSALPAVRILSARCLGVYARGEPKGSGAASGPPHWWQKRLPLGFDARQAAQTSSRRAPQPPQKRASSGLIWPQPGQVADVTIDDYIMTMEGVRIAELKAKLSEYLR